MRQIKEFADGRHKSWCIHCGAWIGAVEANRDHVPSKTLLQPPYPDNLPIVKICRTCNTSFSDDEEYLTVLLSVVRSGSTDPAHQTNPRAAQILKRAPKLRDRIEAARRQCWTNNGETRIKWIPEQDRVRNVIVKNARGHAYYEIGEPMLDGPDRVDFLPAQVLTELQLAAFEAVDFGALWPEVGSRMMTRMLNGEDLKDGWIVVQSDLYRYAVMYTGPIIVKMMLCEYLAAEVQWDCG